jgi:hypothetical protein
MRSLAAPGVRGESVAQGLRNSALALSNARGAGFGPLDQFNAYLRWANEQVRALSPLLRPEALEQLITTPRYWLLNGLDPAAHGDLGGLVNAEVEDRIRNLEQAAAAIESDVSCWSGRLGQFVVADTNIYLHQDDEFDQLPWTQLVPGGATVGVLLVVPLVVIDELDRQKRTSGGVKVSQTNKTEVRSRARRTLRRINDLFPAATSDTATLLPRGYGAGGVDVALLLDQPGHLRLPRADDEIVDRALALRDISGRDIMIATSDTGMDLRARTQQLQVLPFPGGNKQPSVPPP